MMLREKEDAMSHGGGSPVKWALGLTICSKRLNSTWIHRQNAFLDIYFFFLIIIAYIVDVKKDLYKWPYSYTTNLRKRYYNPNINSG